MTRIRTAGLSLLATLVFAAPAYAATYTHNITFDDAEALGWVYGQARSTFASYTTINGQGKVDYCTVPPYTYDGNSCWVYSQRTWDTSHYYWFHVLPWEEPHYHLGFENAAFNSVPACFVDPHDGYGSGFAKRINGVCSTTVPNWAAEPRTLTPHTRASWVIMAPQNTDTNAWKLFKLKSVTIGSNVPIQVWILKQDGTWTSWPNLSGPQTINFTIPGDPSLWEVDIGVSDVYTGGSPMTLGGVQISISD